MSNSKNNIINKNSKKIKSLKNQGIELQESLQKTITKIEHLEKVVRKRGKRIAKIENKLKKHEKSSKKKIHITLAVLIVSLTIFSYAFMQVQEQNIEAYIKDKFVIENLRGDTIDTWISWRLAEDESLYVNIINSANISEANLEVAKNTIFSEDILDIDDNLLHKGYAGTYSTYYLGWQGGLKSAAESETQFVIPTKFEIVESSNGVGDIYITLTSLKDMDGYSGFTKSIVDESQNQILKSQITIYEADKLTGTQLATIMRHELGHALGLAHSSAPEDLMYPQIRTTYPYISDCDLDAITFLYNGGKSSQVVCEK